MWPLVQARQRGPAGQPGRGDAGPGVMRGPVGGPGALCAGGAPAVGLPAPGAPHPGGRVQPAPVLAPAAEPVTLRPRPGTSS